MWNVELTKYHHHSEKMGAGRHGAEAATESSQLNPQTGSERMLGISKLAMSEGSVLLPSARLHPLSLPK